MAEYRFLTTWLLDAPIDNVWSAIVDYPNLSTWWKAVANVEQVQPGEASGVGSIWRLTWKTPLLYTMTFKSTLTRVEAPHHLELTAIGELEGTGRWELSTTESGTLVNYHWNVRTTKAWMNFLALWIRPLMEWNHDAIMHEGGKGLAQYLGTQVLKPEARPPAHDPSR